MEECIVAEANNIKINEYEVKKIKTAHMIMNKDTAVHTCNARNKTFRKMKYLK